jgi:hypothetical protein
MLLNFKNFRIFFLTLLLVSSMIFPTKFQIYRSIILLFVILFSFFFKNYSSQKIYLNNSLFVLFLITFAISFLSLSYSFFLNSPGWLEFSTLYLVWPFLFISLVSVNYDLNGQFFFKKLFPYVFTFLCLSILIFIPFYLLSLYNPFEWYYEALEVRINFISLSPEFSAPFMGWFVFSIPFFYFQFILKWSIKELRPSDFLYLTLALFILFLSGRRGMWFSSFLTICVFHFILLFFDSKSIIKFLIIILIIVVFISPFLLLLGFDFADSFNSILIDLNSSSDFTRTYQISELFKGFLEAPFFGNGIGSITKDRLNYTGADVWAYEMQYNLLLFQVGLFGFLLFLLSTLYVLISLLYKSYLNKDSVLFSFTSGLFGLLLANATNPYLNKFDYIWVLFFGIHMLNQKNG